MSLQELQALIPPPDAPVYCGSGEDWELVENELGTVLPEDYKELISTYGSGGFCNTFGIISPFSGQRGLCRQQEVRGTFFRKMLPTYGKADFAVYPDAGGILYVGGDEYTNSLTWLTNGEPNRWPLILFDDHMHEYEIFEMRLTTFLTQWAIGKIEPLVHRGIFAESPLNRFPLFRPTPV